MNNEMKYVVLLGDGMADLPIESLGNMTPLQYASTPNMDRLAGKGICGTAKTVPDGMAPGSDTANLSVFGYDPSIYYTGRAPLEALNMNIDLGPGDVAFRCNIVNIQNDIMNDFSGGHIDSGFSSVVIEEISRLITIENMEFYPGVSYRNILIWRNYPHEDITITVPPHDISDRNVTEYLPDGPGSEILRIMMEQARAVISGSGAIKEASGIYRGSPTGIWMWGGGRKPSIQTLRKRFGLRGVTISAVDLIHGIGRAAGLTPIPVEGATGYLDTNYEGKAQAALKALESFNYVYLHVEAPDESGHEGSIEHKIKAIEDFDKKIVGPVLEGISRYKNHAVLLMPDHPTPISLKTHTSVPVPFCIYRSIPWDDSLAGKSAVTYDEKSAAATGLFVSEGHRLIEMMINGRI